MGVAADVTGAGWPSFSSSSSSSSIDSGFIVRNRLGQQRHRQQQRRRGAAAHVSGAMRMVSGGDSDEGKFFTDPDAPEVVDGVGPPGPLAGGDQVRTAVQAHSGYSMVSALRASGHMTYLVL